jgi:hypothetical protein
LNSAANLAEVHLSPAEAFVLSRVDGQTSYEEICAMTGLSAEATVTILKKLRREQLLLHPGEETVARPAARSKERKGRGSGAREPSAQPSLLATHDDGSPVDEADLLEGPALDPQIKARIVRLHRRLKSLKPHELLAVPLGADHALVKRAYFAASKELHPDRYFGRDLGPYRARLSDIFAQLTRAFDQLKK